MFKEFLSRLLNKKVDNVQYLRSELSLSNILEKNKTVDVLVKVDEEYIHIELNINSYPYLHTRNLVYFSHIYSKKKKKEKNMTMIKSLFI